MSAPLLAPPLLLPDDAANRALVAAVHPADWVAPTPADRYNLVVIGGGPAGLVAAFGAAGMGAKVALVERHLLGGDCLNLGCVPSKALIAVGHAAQAVRDAARLGVSTGPVAVDFAAAMARMRKIRAGIAPHDSAARLAEAGIDVFLGSAAFTGSDTVQVGASSLRFARCCIATGARAALPPIPGLEAVGALTNEGIFSLTERPDRLTVVGAGVIGCELAQAFARMGCAVTLIDQSDRVLPREEPEASALVQARLQADGVRLYLGAQISGFAREGDVRVTVLADGSRILGDQLLVATGRLPNLDLDLEKAGVAYTRAGITVDDQLRTSNRRIYAAGDVIGQAQFTHAADHQARIVLRNALFFGRARVSGLVIPRVTFTSPEVAAVGLSAEDAARNPNLTTYSVGMVETDRGRTDGENEGYCRVFADSKGRIHGAVIVAAQAGELLSPLTLAMTQGVTLGQIAGTIHPYPTRSELIFRVASAWNRTRLTPTALSLMTRLLAWRR